MFRRGIKTQALKGLRVKVWNWRPGAMCPTSSAGFRPEQEKGRRPGAGFSVGKGRQLICRKQLLCARQAPGASTQHLI